MPTTSRQLAERCCEVVITGPNVQAMTSLTRGLVEDRLAAAGHLTNMRTIYRWEDTVEDGMEVRVILHTRRALLEEIEARVKAEHPFEVPCLIATPVLYGSVEYLQWILDQTYEP